MPLFKCSRCGILDNTALTNFWERHLDRKPPLCSQCDTGTWHGRFPRRTPEEAGEIQGRQGFYYPPRADGSPDDGTKPTGDAA